MTFFYRFCSLDLTVARPVLRVQEDVFQLCRTAQHRSLKLHGKLVGIERVDVPAGDETHFILLI